MTIEGVIEGCFDALSQETKMYINFAALEASNERTDHDNEAIYKQGIIVFLYKKVMSLALLDTNPRVEAYLDSRHEELD